MKTKFLIATLLGGLILSCNGTKEQKAQEGVPTEVKTHKDSQIEKQSVKPVFQNKAHELVYNMVSKAGDYKALLEHCLLYTSPSPRD